MAEESEEDRMLVENLNAADVSLGELINFLIDQSTLPQVRNTRDWLLWRHQAALLAYAYRAKLTKVVDTVKAALNTKNTVDQVMKKIKDIQ